MAGWLAVGTSSFRNAFSCTVWGASCAEGFREAPSAVAQSWVYCPPGKIGSPEESDEIDASWAIWERVQGSWASLLWIPAESAGISVIEYFNNPSVKGRRTKQLGAVVVKKQGSFTLEGREGSVFVFRAAILVTKPHPKIAFKANLLCPIISSLV